MTWRGGQLPDPDECNSTLTSETRGKMLTPNPNECHSTLTSAIRGIYPCLYIYIYSLGTEYDFKTAPPWELGEGKRVKECERANV